MPAANDNALAFPSAELLGELAFSPVPLWKRVEVVGRCILFQGDALAILPILPRIGLGNVDAVFADPPYSSGGQYRGDRVQGTNAKYLNRDQAKRYTEFTGDNRDARSYGHWSALWLDLARQATKAGGLIGVFSDWRQLPITTDAVQSGGWTWRGVAVWDKTEGTRPALGRYRNQVEFLAWGTNGARPLVGPVAPGVFRYAVDRNKTHATAKPVALMRDLISIAGEVILDPFMGSGSTGVACVELDRVFIGIEADPDIYETARARIAAAHAQRQASGLQASLDLAA